MATPELARRLGLGDAVVIGMGSMIGAGVFAAFSPAAEAAGAGLLIGLVIAAVVAYCNATASAQLAAAYPTSGGTYVYGRERLGPWWGFVAGWSFVVGKIASCAAVALTFGEYLGPDGYERALAAGAVIVTAAINYRGITRTAWATRVIVVVVLGVLALAITTSAGQREHAAASWSLADAGWHGVLQSAGILFFAFAGYARIATLGEEVRSPSRTIPRAIAIALGVTVAVYAAVAVVLLRVLGADELAATPDPVAEAARRGAWPFVEPLVQAAAGLACLGALLALMTGIGRTALAMARGRDLPSWLAAVHPRFGSPHHAEVAVAVAVTLVLLSADVRTSIGFSSFGVLLYYLVANVAAATQPRRQRRSPRALQALGGLGCLALASTLPVSSIAVGAAVVLVGVVFRLVRTRAAAR